MIVTMLLGAAIVALLALDVWLDRECREWRKHARSCEDAAQNANRAMYEYLRRAERAEEQLASNIEAEQKLVNDKRKFELRDGTAMTIERHEVRRVREVNETFTKIQTAERGEFIVVGVYDEVREWSLRRE